MNIFEESEKYEDIIVQSNLNGYHEPRIPMKSAHRWNHRKIMISEVVWDIDIHIRNISNAISEAISQNLIKDKISHQVWDTSRSPHIHAFFKDMHLYSQEARKIIRLLTMKQYAEGYISYIDKSKASENNMIRDFNGEHEITGKHKTLVYEFQGLNPSSKKVSPLLRTTNHSTPETLFNPIPAIISSQLREYYNAKANVPEIAYIKPTEANLREMQGFITYCLENTLRADGKKTILSRNVAIACLLLGYDTNARHRIYCRIDQNSTSKILYNLIGWDKWLQKKQDLYFNWKEMELWYPKCQTIKSG